MTSAPIVGATAEVVAHIKADPRVSGASTVTLELPPNMSLVQAPAGFQAGTVAATATDGTVSQRVAGTVNLTANESARVTFQVKPLRAGDGNLRVIATDPSRTTPASEGSIALTYGADSNSTKFGITIPALQPLQLIPSTARPVLPKATLSASGATPPQTTNQRQRTGGAHAAATTCADGTFNYSDKDGVWHVAPNIWVRVYDQNSSGDVLLASGVTSSTGAYHLCFNNAETSSSEASTADLYVLFTARVNQWTVQRTDGSDYRWKTGTTNNVPTGTKNFGNLTSGNPNSMRAIHLFDTINSAFWSIPVCWDRYGACEQKIAYWEPDLDTWPHIERPSGIMFVPGPAPDYPAVNLHELGHQVMWDSYDHNWPSGTCESPHYVDTAENAGCAWREGWPNWFAGHVLQNKQQTFWSAPKDSNGVVLNLQGYSPANTLLEDSSWWNDGYLNADYGDTVESRIASALWDIEDSIQENYWDRSSGGFSQLWETFQKHNSSTFAGYWNDRDSDGYDDNSQNILATLYQNTIELVPSRLFQDTLTSGTTYSRPDPPAATVIQHGTSNHHTWKLTRSGNCQAVSVKPKGTATLGLHVFSSSGLTNELLSASASGTIRTVVFMQGTTAPITVYPQVQRTTGSGGYSIQAKSCVPLSPLGRALSLSSTNIVNAMGLTLSPGKSTKFTATPATGSTKLDIALTLLKKSTSATLTESVKIATADSGGAGKSESISFTATTGDYVLLATTVAGPGTFTVTQK